MDDHKQIDRETLELFKIRQRVYNARRHAVTRRGGPNYNAYAQLSAKPHFQLHVILGKSTGRPLWIIGTNPEQLRACVRYNSSGDAIRAVSRLELYKLTQQRCIEPAPTNRPHSDDCPCGACSGKVRPPGIKPRHFPIPLPPIIRDDVP